MELVSMKSEWTQERTDGMAIKTLFKTALKYFIKDKKI
jgi:hypothetical protein